jgi:hypothetical protein
MLPVANIQYLQPEVLIGCLMFWACRRVVEEVLRLKALGLPIPDSLLGKKPAKKKKGDKGGKKQK